MPEPPEAAADEAPAPAEADGPPAAGRLDIVLERKGRAGKQATIICGFTCSDARLAEIASQLKRALATGGSARAGEILIQGDRRADALRALTAMGLKARII